MKNMSHAKLLNYVRKLGACQGAIDWLKKNKYDLAAAWKNCDKPQWMFWFLERMPGFSMKRFEGLIHKTILCFPGEMTFTRYLTFPTPDVFRRKVRVTK